MLHNVSSRISPLIPESVTVSLGLIAELQSPLLPEECIESKSRARIREFRAGRNVAKLALNKLSSENLVIRRHSSGWSLFPDSYSGSISHKHPIVGAMALRHGIFVGVGFDIEEAESLGEAVWSTFASSNEIANAIIINVEDGIYANMLFSLKESIFKCLSPLLGEGTPELSAQEIHVKIFNNQYVANFSFGGYSCQSTILDIDGYVICWTLAARE